MSALFKVNASFVLRRSDPRLTVFVISGEIIEGTVRRGMLAQLLSGSEVLFSQCIYGVEYVLLRGGEEVGLTFQPQTPGQLADWKNIQMVGQVFRIA